MIHDSLLMPYIFVVGHNLSRAEVLHVAFHQAGYNTCKWDMGKIARFMLRNFALSLPPMTGYEHYGVFSDIECTLDYYSVSGTRFQYLYQPYKLFPLIASCYPNAVFIYNRRNVHDWIYSRLQHGGGSYAMLYLQSLLIEGSLKVSSIKHVIEHWHREWLHHDNLVLNFLERNPSRLIVIDVDNIDISAINKFLLLHGLNELPLNSVINSIEVCPRGAVDMIHLESLASKTVDLFSKSHFLNSHD
jgi:hypothetical protein